MVLNFDFLSGWRRSDASQQMSLTPVASQEEGYAEGDDDAQGVLLRPRGPFPADAVGIDARQGLWWLVQDSDLLFFPFPGEPSSPLGAYALPDAKLQAACVAPLTGAVYKGSSSIRKPTLAVVFSDWRISVFPNGPRVDLGRPPGIPAEEVPAFVRSAAPHPGHGCVGVVLVVGTQSGLLFSLFLTQEGPGGPGSFKVEAGKFWPTVSEHCLYNFFKRVRRFRTGADVSQDRHMQEETPFLAQKIETVSASSSSSLFATLAWNQEQLAYYTHPRWVGAADLVWTVSLAQLVAGDPSTKLLSVCYGGKNEGCDDSILVLYRGKDTAGSEASLLARLAWPARTAPVQSSCQQGEVVGPPSPVNGPGFVVAFGDIVVSAIKVEGGDRFAICMTGLAGQRLQAGVSQIVDYGILGLSLLPEGISGGHMQVLTPHGLLSCPQDMTAVGKETGGQLPSTADAFIQMAYGLFDAGQEEQAVSISVRAFSQVGAQPMLLAVEQRTRKLLDADTSPKRTAREPLDIRQMLITKARSLEHWLQFLQKVGIWIRMGSAPNITSAQQNVVEACERAAAAMRLVEYHDTASDVFASAIHNALDQGMVQEAEDEKRSFFNCLSGCERLLGSLAEYPRTLPFGSGGAWDAVIFVQSVVSAFLDAALEKRSQILASYPMALPVPEPQMSRRYFGSKRCSRVPPWSGVGSGWLMSVSVQRALEDLRVVSLEVLPTVPRRHLPLLDAQAIRVVQGLQQLCRGILLAAYASFSDLHCTAMAKIRKEVLSHLADAEACLVEKATVSGQQLRTLQFAEEFEDLELFIKLAANADVKRLDEQMAASEKFRPHAFVYCLQQPRLHPLFFRLLRLFPPSSEALEELLSPYPELRWTLELSGLAEASKSRWPVAAHSVKQMAEKAAANERLDATRRKVMAAVASIAAAATQMQETPAALAAFRHDALGQTCS